VQSDAAGIFSLKDIKAFGVDAVVFKNGYRTLPGTARLEGGTTAAINPLPMLSPAKIAPRFYAAKERHGRASRRLKK